MRQYAATSASAGSGWHTSTDACRCTRAGAGLLSTSGPGTGATLLGVNRHSGEGSGAAAVEEQELVDENQHLVDQFRKDLAEQLANTMNYEALEIEGSDIVFMNQDVLVTPEELTSFLEFVVLAEE